jgi:lipoprotein-anchoring transpeptidase ErfK/SrfK
MTMRALRLVAVLAASASLAAACSTSGSGSGKIASTSSMSSSQGNSLAARNSSSAPGSSAPASTTTPSPSPTAHATVVHVSAMESDQGTYGVGMPVVLFFTPAPTNSAAFTKAVTVTVNGQPANGAWYWEQPTADEVDSHTVEAHYRLPQYWPADSRVHVSIPIGGLSAGRGLVYDNKLTSLDFHIGDAHISHVNGRTLRMRVTSNGKLVNTFAVSLGEAKYPTYEGVKVVMQKGEDVPGTDQLRPNGTVLMSGPGYTDDPVAWSVRVTRSGEYVHAAPWNSEIGQASTSHGCTNLTTKDADWFYHFAQVGDVVTYTDTGGGPMPSWDGLGDWNVAWSQWQAGGLLRTH